VRTGGARGGGVRFLVGGEGEGEVEVEGVE